MNTRAGAQLKTRNPAAAAPTKDDSKTTGKSPSEYEIPTNPTATATAASAAMPSDPSMKLKALMNPTIHTTLSGQASQPKSINGTPGMFSPRTGPSTATIPAATPICTTSRRRARSGRMSSQKPTMAMMKLGRMTPRATGRA